MMRLPKLPNLNFKFDNIVNNLISPSPLTGEGRGEGE